MILIILVVVVMMLMITRGVEGTQGMHCYCMIMSYYIILIRLMLLLSYIIPYRIIINIPLPLWACCYKYSKA